MFFSELLLILRTKVINNVIPSSGIIFRFKPTQQNLLLPIVVVVNCTRLARL